MTIAASLIAQHREDIPDADWIIEKILVLMEEERQYYEDKKPSTCKNTFFERYRRNKIVLDHNLVVYRKHCCECE